MKDPATTFNNLTKNIAYLIKKEQPERLEQMANGFEVAGTKLYYTISNLLDWVTSQRGTIVSETNQFDLATLLEEVVDSLNFQMQLKSVAINYALETRHQLTTDRNILRIILFNILNNAIKFSNANEAIVVKYCYGSAFDTIEIIDAGPGMEADLIKRIRSEEIITTRGTHHEKGYGIGLKIWFALIQQLKGKITIESEVGKGSTFGVLLPV